MLQGVCKEKLKNKATTLDHLCEQKLGLSGRICSRAKESSDSQHSHKG